MLHLNRSIMAERPSNIDESDWASLQDELKRLGATSGGLTPQQLMTATPEQLGNERAMEVAWATKAGKHAETYGRMVRLFANQPNKQLKLTLDDQRIYEHFRREFPNLDVAYVSFDAIKNSKAKQQWHTFCMTYAEDPAVTDFNFGTLLRVEAARGYTQDNVIIVPRIQFLAIEIARNREGKNVNVDWRED